MNVLGRHSAATTTVLAGLGGGALLGLLDVGLHGDGLEGHAAGVTVVLWVLIVLPFGLLAGFVVWLRKAPPASGSPVASDRPAGRRVRTLALSSLFAAPLLAIGVSASRFEAPHLPAASPLGQLPPSGENVVLIVLDTLRADHVGALGSDEGLTPHLDAFSRSALSFERCFATAAWTVPTHASLFTGLFATSHGASFEHERWLGDHFTTLAEGLREAGYRTAAFVSNPHLARANLDQGFELYREVTSPFASLALRKPLAALGGPARWIDEGASQSAREVEALLEDRTQTGDTSPLLLFINLLEPHWRHLPPARERREAASRRGYVATTLSATGFYGPLAMANGSLAAHDLEAIRALYAAEVRYQDTRLGEILASIERHLDPRRTLVIITADHGENLGEGGRFDHIFALNDHLIRVPLFIRLPGLSPAGLKRTDLCQSVDVPATIRAVLGGPGATIPTGVGRDLTATDTAPRRHVFAEGDPYIDHLERMRAAGGDTRRLETFAQPLQAVRDQRFKLVQTGDAPPALYDLDTDPDELRDIAQTNTKRREELERALEDWRREQPPFVGGTGARRSQTDPDTRARLEALGYAR